MALATSKISGGSVTTNCAKLTDPSLIIYSFTKTAHSGLPCRIQRVEFRKQNAGHCLGTKISFSSDGCWLACGYPYNYVVLKERDVFCLSTGTHNNETKECPRPAGDCSGLSRGQTVDGEVGETYDPILGDERIMPKSSSYSSQGLTEACKFAHNDAKFVNERARNDIVLLSRGIMRLNDRARQDVAILGSEFLKLDARAREDTEKIDYTVKKRAECLHHIAMILKDKAGSKLKRVADQHWSDGALEADLRRADDLVKRRAMEDACMALELVKNVHDMMVRKMYKIPGKLSSSGNDVRGQITLEKNGKALEFLHGEVSVDRITALQEVYWSMASALSEADGIDYTDPEELELLVTTLIDLDAMDGKSSVSLLAECSSSPDVSTRQALANALAAAPSMWTLGNAGMGALQRLAEDSNPAVAAAASKAIVELKRQWEIEEGDSWRFTMNYLKPVEEAQNCEETDEEEEDSSSTDG